MTPTRSALDIVMSDALGARREARFGGIEALSEAMKALHLRGAQMLRTFDRLHVDWEASP